MPLPIPPILTLFLLFLSQALSAPTDGIFEIDLDDSDPIYTPPSSSSPILTPPASAGVSSPFSPELLRQLSSASSHRSYQSPFASALLAGYDVTCHGPSLTEDILGMNRPSYASLEELCTNSWDDNPPGLGCECSTDGKVPRVKCLRGPSGLDGLWVTRAPVICRDRCGCRAKSAESEKSDGEDAMRSRSRSRSGLSGLGARGGSFASLSGSGYGMGSMTLKLCGSRCSGSQGCLGNGGSVGQSGRQGCECVVKKEYVDVRTRQSWFSGACQAISVGRKREVEGCMCNSTYVSSGCCGADKGLVWESPQAKLGEMIDGLW